MSKCKCGSYAINHRRHGRVPERHSDLCDVCYWRAEAAQARADALRWVLEQLDYKTPEYFGGGISSDVMNRVVSEVLESERSRLRAIIEKELSK